MHACMQIRTFGECPSPSDRVARGCMTKSWVYTIEVDNEPSGRMHACMQIRTFGECPSPSDRVARGCMTKSWVYTIEVDNEPPK